MESITSARQSEEAADVRKTASVRTLRVAKSRKPVRRSNSDCFTGHDSRTQWLRSEIDCNSLVRCSLADAVAVRFERIPLIRSITDRELLGISRRAQIAAAQRFCELPRERAVPRP